MWRFTMVAAVQDGHVSLHWLRKKEAELNKELLHSCGRLSAAAKSSLRCWAGKLHRQ